MHTTITIKRRSEDFHLTYVLNDENGEPLFTFSHTSINLKLKNGINYVTCIFPKGYLNIGTYYLSIYIIENSRTTLFTEKDILSFSVQEGERNLGSWMGKEPGFIKPIFNWRIN